MEATRDKVATSEPGVLPWKHLIISFQNNMVTSHFFVLVNTWDQTKFSVTRRVLQQFREGFYAASSSAR